MGGAWTGVPAGEPPRLPAVSGVKTRRLLTSLAREVLSGEYPAGSRLPSARELGDRHDVSRTVVREALAALQSAGYVTVRPGAGVFVADRPPVGPEPDRSAAPAFAVPGDPALAGAREAVELGVLAVLPARPDAGRLAEAAGCLARMRAARTPWDPAGFLRAALDFHPALAAATGNPVVVAVTEQLVAGVRAAVPALARGYREADAGEALAGHEELYAALAAGDPDRAAGCVRRHYRGTPPACLS